MDNLDLYADEELYEDEEEQAVEEGSNRTFIILVVSLGGLLAVTVCIFVIWAFVFNPRMTASRVAENQATEATNEALLAAAGMLTETVPLEDTTPEAATPVPTDASDEPTATANPPTATSRPATATPVPPTVAAIPAEAADATAEAAGTTPAEVAGAATTAAGATASPQATPTPRPGKSGVPETGIGTLWAGVLAVGLLFLLLVVRRVRRAV